MRALLKHLDDKLSRWWLDTPVMTNGLIALVVIAAWNLSSSLQAWGDDEFDVVPNGLNLLMGLGLVGWVWWRRRQVRVIHLPDDPDTPSRSRRLIVPRRSPLKPEDYL